MAVYVFITFDKVVQLGWNDKISFVFDHRSF